MTGHAQIIRGNALDLPFPDGSVDLVVTSPPYFGLRSYQDGGVHYDGQVGSEATPAEFVDTLITATTEMVRVLKPSGSIWVNLGDRYGPAKSLLGIPWRYTLRCMDDLGLALRAEVIWNKPNGLPESVTDRVRRSHEQWFHFTTSPRYYSAVDEIREPYDPATASRYAAGYNTRKLDSARPTINTNLGGDTYDQNPLGKLPGSVWTIPTQPLTVPPALGVDHFAAFPMEWPRRIIRAWSPPHGVVLDPFGGTGTTALVAKANGRTGISIDLSGDYCRLASWRTSDPGQLAAAAQVPKPPPELEGQLDLFGSMDTCIDGR